MRKLLGTFFGVGWIPGPAGTYASAITAALLPTSVKQLRDALQEERRTEKLTYHARPPRKKSPTP
jgi:hypothetical protein